MLRNAEVVPNSNTHSRRNNDTSFITAISNKYRILCGILLRRPTFKNALLLSVIGTACVVGFVLVILLSKRFSGKNSQLNLCTTIGCVISAAKILESINDSADPCDDFYEYACGKWSHSHFISLQEENSWFIERKQHINYLITNLLAENSSSEMEPVSQMKQLYNMCMDTDHLNQQGLEPLYRVLDLLQLPRSFPDNETVGNFSLAKTLSLAQRILNLDIIIQLSTHFSESLNLTVLSMSPASNDLFSLNRKRRKSDPESDEFAEKMLAIRLAYMIGIIVEFDTGNITENDIVTEVMRIILLESQLKMDKDETTKNETEESYMTLDLLQQMMFSNISSEMTNITELNFYWLDYVTVLTQDLNITLTMESTVQVINPSYFQVLGNRMVEFNSLFFQRYVWWKVVDLLATHTTDIMRTHKYIFEQRIYHEMTKPTRSFTCIGVIKSYFNEALIYKMAKLYDIFDVKEEIETMVSDLKQVFEELIVNSVWINDNTKDAKMKTLKSIKTLIGSPEVVLNTSWIIDHYKNIEISSREFIGTLLMIKARESTAILSLIHRQNRSETDYVRWFMDPMDVNAYYSFSINSIAVPFGILQYPFYLKSINALNYGAIGSILGHEFTHAFHDENHVKGEERPALSNETVQEYLFECFISQYDDYVVADNLKVDGAATLSENVADYGGIRAAILAYEKRSQKTEPESSLPGLEQYSHQQIVFLSFANMWCMKESKSGIEFRIRDEHSPNRFRVLGSLTNLEEFSEAWNCPLNSRMNPEKKCKLW